jgi:hypothetical protein
MLAADRDELRRRAEARGGGGTLWCREFGRLPGYEEPQPALFDGRSGSVTGASARRGIAAPDRYSSD